MLVCSWWPVSSSFGSLYQLLERKRVQLSRETVSEISDICIVLEQEETEENITLGEIVGIDFDLEYIV